MGSSTKIVRLRSASEEEAAGVAAGKASAARAKAAAARRARAQTLSKRLQGCCASLRSFPSHAWAWLRTHRGTCVFIYCLCFAGLGLCLSTLGPVLLELAVQTDSSLQYTGYSFAVRSAGYALGSGLGGLYDHYPGHAVLGAALVFGGGLATCLIPLTRSLPALMACVIAQGIGMGLCDTGGNLMTMWAYAEGGQGQGEGDAGGSQVAMQCLHFAFAAGATLGPLFLRAFQPPPGSSSSSSSSSSSGVGSVSYGPAYWLIGLACAGIGGALWTRKSPQPGGGVGGQQHAHAGTGAAPLPPLPVDPHTVSLSQTGREDWLSEPLSLGQGADSGLALPTPPLLASPSAGGGAGGGGGRRVSALASILPSTPLGLPNAAAGGEEGEGEGAGAVDAFPPAAPARTPPSAAAAGGAGAGGGAGEGSDPWAAAGAVAPSPSPSSSSQPQQGQGEEARGAESSSSSGSGPPAPLPPALTRGPVLLLVLSLSSLLALYVGAETGYGAYLTPYAVLHLGWSEGEGQLLAGWYWAAICAGRFSSIWTARVMSSGTMLSLALAGSAASSLLLLLFRGNDGTSAALLPPLTAAFGLSMACVFPTALSWAEAQLAPYPVSGRQATFFVVGAAGGELLLPFIIATLFGNAGAGAVEEGKVGPTIMVWVVAGACVAQLAAWQGVQVLGERVRRGIRAHLAKGKAQAGRRRVG